MANCNNCARNLGFFGSRKQCDKCGKSGCKNCLKEHPKYPDSETYFCSSHINSYNKKELGEDNFMERNDGRTYQVLIEHDGNDITYDSLSKKDAEELYVKVKTALTENKNFVEIYDINELLSLKGFTRMKIEEE